MTIRPYGQSKHNQGKAQHHSPDNLPPLARRLKPVQVLKRAAKIETRRLVAGELSRQNAQTRGLLVGFIYLPFWQRLRWLFFGLPRPAQQPQQSQE